MNDQLQSIVVGTAGLTVALVISALLTVFRNGGSDFATHRISRLIWIAALLHTIHFTEETLTGFYQRFPELLGLTPWPVSFFVVFNACWVILWIICIPLLKTHRTARVPIWFLGISSAINAIAHPIMSIITGGYFPGLWTSPVVGILGFILLRALVSATQERRVPG